MKKSLVDFYWVSSVWNAPDTSAWHITIRDTAETMDEVAQLGAATRDRVVNVAQAIAEGFTLDVIGATINSQTLSDSDTLKTQITQLQSQLDSVSS